MPVVFVFEEGVDGCRLQVVSCGLLAKVWKWVATLPRVSRLGRRA